MSGRRSREGRRRVAGRCLAVLGAGAAALALFMPWVSVRLDGPLAAIAGLVGAADAEPIAGWRIPGAVRDAGGNALVQGVLGLDELLSGRLDLCAARILFGERYEEAWAPAVFAPAAIAVLAAGVVLRLRSRIAAAAAGVLLAQALVAVGWLAADAGRGDPGIALHGGVAVTALGLAIAAAGAFLVAGAPGRRRRR